MSLPCPELVHKWSHVFSIISIVSFPKKKLLFAGTQDSKILVFNLPTYDLIRTIKLGDAYETNTRSSVLCLERSRDENYLFSAGADSLVRIWSIYEVDRSNGSIKIEEVATVYSVTDIGDIFSIRYLDSLQTLVFGCQNASILYLDKIFERLLPANCTATSNIDRLPHRRYDKFFDSLGPTGKSCNPHRSEVPSNTVHRRASQEGSFNRILEIPSENIINYAHNGFVYTISNLCLECSSLLGNRRRVKYSHVQKCSYEYEYEEGHEYEHEYEQYRNSSTSSECIISGGGDGISKVWFLTKDENGSVTVDLLATELDNEESVLAQATEFPFLYCGLSDGIIKIWDLSTKQLVSTLYSPDKSDIISVSVYRQHIFAINEAGITLFYENEVKHWNPHQGKMLSCDVFERHFKPSGKQISLLIGGSGGSLTLWDLSNVLRTTPSKEETVGSLPERSRSHSWTHFEPIKLDKEVMLSTLRDLVAFQSVSQNADTAEQLESRRCATYLETLFVNCGAEKAQLLPVESGDNPVVFAHFKGKGQNKKRILWYGHYDVIPPGDRHRWKTDPFTLTCENGYMKGRGTSDNKGPLVAAVYSVASLLQKDELLNDVVFLVEGNEEIGSPGLDQVCERYKELIGENINWIFLSNSTWVDQEHPCLNYGLRGVINAQITIWSDKPDRHSGVDGGMGREPTADLIGVIAKLQDDDGKIQIPHFYSPLKKLSTEDYQRFEEIVEVAQFDKNITVEELITNWTKPSLSITTMTMSGPGNVTVIPKSATVGISIRLVPEQGVEKVKKALTSYIEKCFTELRSKNHLEITVVNTAEAWLGDPTNHAYKILKEEMTATWETEPLFVKEGGSIPCIRSLERIFDAPAVQIPCGQSTDNAHLDNENLRIKNWSNLVEVLSGVFKKL